MSITDPTGRTALVTGASMGLGAGIAEVLAERKCDLILVARSEDKLRALAEKLSAAHGVRVDVIAQDLGTDDGPERMVARVRELGRRVDYVINNAGIGTIGPFTESDWERDREILALNLTAVHKITRLLLPELLANMDGGRIMNVASVVGFMPVPRLATYAATKAYVLSFSQSLAYELRATKVRVTALCPGGTATEFWNNAGNYGSGLLKATLMPTRPVAEYGVKRMLAGAPIAVPGFGNRVMVFCVRLLPRTLVNWISAKTMGG